MKKVKTNKSATPRRPSARRATSGLAPARRQVNAAASGVNWLWWKVHINKEEVSVSRQAKVLLSKHFLNLRPSPLTRPDNAGNLASRISPPTRQHNIKSAKTNLTANATVHSPLPVTQSKSGVGLLLKAIATDVRNYASVIREILIWPAQKVKTVGRRVAGAPLFFRYRQSTRWPQIIILLSFIILAILPLRGIAIWRNLDQQRGQIVQLTQQGAEQIKKGTDNLSVGNLAGAETDFRTAADNFAAAAAVLEIWPERVWQILRLIPGKAQQYATGNYLVAASREISAAAAEALSTWRTVATAAASHPANLANNFKLTKPALENIKQRLALANYYLDKVNPQALPLELRSVLTLMQNELIHITAQLDDFITFPQFIEQAVVNSDGAPQTFVFIFQNPSELRPTGGFMGSLALMKIVNGQVEEVNIPGGGPYDYQGQLSRTIRPPEPLRLVRGTWQLQDANWWFDFPTSARKIMWFMEQSGAPASDGVIAITASLVVELLKLTGPIELPTYNKILTAENFYRETQKTVDIEYDRSRNRPKQFIADLAPILLDKIISLPAIQQPALLLMLEQGLAQRDIQIYLSDPQLQTLSSAYDWSGEIKSTPLDYLAVVRTNIGGGKTDLVTADKISHTANINDDGTINVVVTYQRHHQGKTDDIFTRRRNVNYVRFYVSRGAELLAADGFTPPPDNYYRPVPEGAEFDEDLLKNEQLIGYHQPSGTKISEEFDKTVFANWISVSPGEEKIVQLVYRLPFVLRPDSNWQDLRRYQVYFQHQAGTGPVEFSSQVKLPTAWRLRWQRASAPLSLNNQNQTITFSSSWTKDDYYALIIEKTY